MKTTTETGRVLRERDREREREKEREREGGGGDGERAREREGREPRGRAGERDVFIGNSTSWITNIQGAKYKIQVNSN